ncbi:hypothetical protein K435DRAFT_842241 [Dendrothele bispora CBS 962.96]|uniref:Nephrocystin 3-like N-terminal domain-containing protein n=1 Tax=Dendrothele bispora (strain CBS 962.96) TaxID=1314807 RepID=A0A4S8LHC3_DENBC|nr:hypothetical protein K435DRAFT_842241 [Dendrothele bispora CBS 962.96]
MTDTETVSEGGNTLVGINFTNNDNNYFRNVTMNAAGRDQYNYYASSGVLNIKEVIDWLDAPDPSTNYVTARDKRVEGTGIWLLNHPQFIQWKVNGHLFWLQGKAGSGKTFLCTNVITHLQNQGHQVFYYYFDSLGSGHSKVTYKGVLASLLVKLGMHNNYDQSLLKTLYQNYSQGTSKVPDDIMLDTVLELMNKCPGDTYIILDAMDECKESKKVMKLIQQLLEVKKTYVAVSSRFPVDKDLEKLDANEIDLAQSHNKPRVA